jgi:hypothetical protein
MTVAELSKITFAHCTRRETETFMNNREVASTPALLEMFVVDVMRHDVIENVPAILKMINDDGCIGWREFWPQDFTVIEVTTALKRLAGYGHVDVLEEIGGEVSRVDPGRFNPENDYSQFWFTLTDTGKSRWEHWDPPTST